MFNQYFPKRFELIGGEETECLAEMELVFDVRELNYKTNHRYVY